MELEDFRKKSWPGFEFQRFLCVWLRIAKNLSTKDIAHITGWNVNTVRCTQKDFIDNGVSALLEMKRGGRNHANLTAEEENELLASFEASAEKGSMLTANEIKEALEQRAGHKIHKTTVYRMLHRHGWRKIMPKPGHPKRDKEAGEAFKKGASPNRQRRLRQTGSRSE
jgi:transposase